MRLPERPKDATTVGNYLKLKDGESVVGIFRGETYSFRIKWENGKSSHVLDPNPANHNRWKLNFVMKEGNAFVAKLWEFGVTVYDQLAEINSEYDLDKTKVKISRRGTGTDTQYSILPLLKEPIPPQIMKEIESTKLNPIVKDSVIEPRANPVFDEMNPPMPEDPDGLPF